MSDTTEALDYLKSRVPTASYEDAARTKMNKAISTLQTCVAESESTTLSLTSELAAMRSVVVGQAGRIADLEGSVAVERARAVLREDAVPVVSTSKEQGDADKK